MAYQPLAKHAYCCTRSCRCLPCPSHATAAITLFEVFKKAGLAACCGSMLWLHCWWRCRRRCCRWKQAAALMWLAAAAVIPSVDCCTPPTRPCHALADFGRQCRPLTALSLRLDIAAHHTERHCAAGGRGRRRGVRHEHGTGIPAEVRGTFVKRCVTRERTLGSPVIGVPMMAKDESQASNRAVLVPPPLQPAPPATH